MLNTIALRKSIGDNAVIGANAVVVKDVEAGGCNGWNTCSENKVIGCNMIQNAEDLKLYLEQDMQFYYVQSKKERFMYWITNDPVYSIAKYIRLLRKEEYYANVRTDKLGTLMYLYYLRRKNTLGNKLGFKIPKNCFGPGLTIYHHGEIIVNEDARIGANCKLHGGNCIGNNGKFNLELRIGDNLDMGIGAKIVGNVILENDVTVGANAVVTKTWKGNNITLVGIPAKVLVK